MRLPAILTSPIGTVLRYLCSIALLTALAWQVDWHQFGALRGLAWSLAGPAVLVAGFAYVLQAWRWQRLLTALEFDLPSGWVHRVFWIGLFYNSFLPGGVGGDAVRFTYLWKEYPAKKTAAIIGLAADRLIGLIALLALAAIALGLHLGPTQTSGTLHVVLISSLVTFVILAGAGWATTHGRWWVPICARLIGRKRTSSVQAAVDLLKAHQVALFAALALSVGVWILDFLSLWLLARSLGINVDPLVVTVAASAAYVAATLPISIGGHGVREGALVMMFGLLDVSGGDHRPIAALALAFGAIAVGWTLFGGVAFFIKAAPRSPAIP